jgi:hypothetical protein
MNQAGIVAEPNMSQPYLQMKHYQEQQTLIGSGMATPQLINALAQKQQADIYTQTSYRPQVFQQQYLQHMANHNKNNTHHTFQKQCEQRILQQPKPTVSGYGQSDYGLDLALAFASNQ